MTENEDIPISIDDDEKFAAIGHNIVNGVLKRIPPDAGPAVVAKVLRAFVSRLNMSVDSLQLLRCHAEHDFTPDAATILRTMYDVMLQGLYVIADPSKAEKRANLYLDYYWVEKYLFFQIVKKNPSSMCQQILTSPLRPEAEPEICQNFERVEQAYRTEKSHRHRDKWYRGNLHELAKETGLDNEYKVLQRTLSATVHTSPMSARHGPVILEKHVLFWAWAFVSRVVHRIADNYDIELTESEHRFLKIFDYNLLDTPEDKTMDGRT